MILQVIRDLFVESEEVTRSMNPIVELLVYGGADAFELVD